MFNFITFNFLKKISARLIYLNLKNHKKISSEPNTLFKNNDAPTRLAGVIHIPHINKSIVMDF